MSPGCICRLHKASEASCATPSTRPAMRFLAALYIQSLMVVLLVIFSRNVFSTAIRTVLLPLLR
jgi:hypothetical protein